MAQVNSLYADIQVSYKNKNQNRVMTKKVLIQASALLNKNTMKGGTAANGSLYPLGWYSGSCPSHHNRGHLIGKALGGTGEDLKNLVTLTSGSNHPFMYSIEGKVKRYVEQHPNVTFMYEVNCGYDDYQNITIANGVEVPAASGNPFCIFPAPSHVTMSLRPSVQQGPSAYVTLGSLCSKFGDPLSELGVTAKTINITIPNGGYKTNGSSSHIGYCRKDSRYDPIADQAQSQSFLHYAAHVGYDVT